MKLHHPFFNSRLLKHIEMDKRRRNWDNAVPENLSESIAVLTKECCILSHVFQLLFYIVNQKTYLRNTFAYKSNHNKSRSRLSGGESSICCSYWLIDQYRMVCQPIAAADARFSSIHSAMYRETMAVETVLEDVQCARRG